MTKEMERFRGGSWDSAYTYLGAHPAAQGYTFRVWAPHARHVALAGELQRLAARGHAPRRGRRVVLTGGEAAAVYDAYKYVVNGAGWPPPVWKADPFAFHAQTRPGTDSKVYDLSEYGWARRAWREKCAAEPPVNGPLLIYEVASWAPGAAMRTAPASATVSWPASFPPTSGAWATTLWSCCR